jgi:hypothetical protein
MNVFSEKYSDEEAAATDIDSLRNLSGPIYYWALELAICVAKSCSGSAKFWAHVVTFDAALFVAFEQI